MTARIVVTLTAFLMLSVFAAAAGETPEKLVQRPVLEEALFFELPELDSGSHVLEASVFVDDALRVTEVLELLSAAPGTAPAAELLAFHPDVRTELLALDGSRVRFEIAVDGEPVADVTLEELRAKTAESRDWGFTPVELNLIAPTAEVAAASGGPGSLTCQEECAEVHQRCESSCGVPPAEDCLQRCDFDYTQCLNACAAPPPCPTTREYTVVTTVSATYVGPSRCLEDHLVRFRGRVYDRLYRTDKATRYRETTNCDGTKTTQVIGVSYNSYYCWARSPFSCSPYASNFGYLICL